MAESKQCSLCGCYARLQKSHIIPKFAADWLKKTSATGYLRKAVNPNVRIQDAVNLNLLCRDCEGRLSKSEKLFAENIFIPFHEEQQQVFQYGEWLLLFAVSLAWRTVIPEREQFQEQNPNLAQFVDDALNCWSAFLLGNSADPGSYEHHIFFLDIPVQAQNIDLPNRFSWYLTRTIDSTIVNSSKSIYAYTLLPGILFWSGIEPPRPEGWDNTRIARAGVLKGPQNVSQPMFGGFLLDRAQNVENLMSTMSEQQRNRIGETLLKDPDKALASRDFVVHLIEQLQKERRT